MKLKRVLAREWLLFLLLLFLTPGVVSVYHWVRAPKTSEDIPEEHPRLYDLLVTAPSNDAQLLIAPNLPKGTRDTARLKFIAKRPLKGEAVNPAEIIYDEKPPQTPPEDGLNQINVVFNAYDLILLTAVFTVPVLRIDPPKLLIQNESVPSHRRGQTVPKRMAPLTILQCRSI